MKKVNTSNQSNQIPFDPLDLLSCYAVDKLISCDDLALISTLGFGFSGAKDIVPIVYLD